MAQSTEVSLAQRLVVAVVTPVGLLIVAAIALALQVAKLNDASFWVDHTDAVIGRVNEAAKQINDQQAALRGFALTGDANYIPRFDESGPYATLSEVLQLVGDNAQQVARVEAARHHYQEWLDAWRPFLVPGADLAPVRASSWVRADTIRKGAVRTGIIEILGVEDGLRRERQETMRSSNRTLLVTALPLFLVLAAAIAFIARSQLREVARTYSATLDSERQTRKTIEEQNWIRTCQMKLAQGIAGDITLDEIASRAVRALAEDCAADLGAFYIRDGGQWRRRGGVGLDAKAPETFAVGEGLVGRAAESESVVRVHDVPGDYLKARSGTGDRSPSEVALVPCAVDSVVVCVVELGFLRSMSTRAGDLLSRIGEVVATAVRSAEYKGRLRDLLEEAQRQGEELQSQQEELRVTNEELQSQGDALRSAHAQLEERKEELEASNTSLEAQRAALEKAQFEIGGKAVELERASRYKSEFLANMSHELRTPLNSTLILAKLLSENREGNLNGEQIRFAQTIYSAGNDLLALINDVLDLSKIEAGRFEIVASPIGLRELVDPVVEQVAPIAKDKGLTFKVSIAPSVALETDAQRVQQILRNLLSNAMKFTEHGEVSLTARSEGDDVVYAVRDTGIGIRLDEQSIIFDAFRQADGTANRRFGGTGLGLAISRDLARMLGGDLSVESELGKGSTFALRVPRIFDAKGAKPVTRAPSPAPSNPPPPARRDSSPPSMAMATPAFSDDRDALDASRRLLLLVDDDVPFARILADLAHEMGYQCLVAHTADDAVKLAVARKPNAIVLDMNLPDHTGLWALDRLKREPVTRHIPVHVVSAVDHTQAALWMGAAGYLLKPVAREDLRTTLKSVGERFTGGRNLLVVEDDPRQRESVCQLLAGPEVDIVAVASVAEALEAIRSRTFDCIVTDLSLPDASGFELLEKLASDEAYAFPPVIVYTGRSLTLEEEQRLRKYSSSIIVKGARSPERLLDEVTLFLHQVESELPPERQKMLKLARDREAILDGRRILIVEDDVRNIFALSSVLEPKGCRLTLARNGREALDVLDKTPDIELVLMDVMMPEMDGLTATRLIRKRTDRVARVPIIALTAKAMRDDQEKCLEAGANDYIAKPIDVEMLLSLLRVWLPK